MIYNIKNRAALQLSGDDILAALAQYSYCVSPVDLAVELGGADASLVRQLLRDLGDAVCDDGFDRWKIRTSAPPKLRGSGQHACKPKLKRDRDDAQKIKQEILDLTRKFFVDMGKRLIEVRDRKLYRFEHKTFEQWCEKELGIKRSRAYQLIDSCQVFANLKNVHDCGHFLPLPTSEYQVRYLAKLEPDRQIEVWQQAIVNNNGQIPTGQLVKQIVHKTERTTQASGETPDDVSSRTTQATGAHGSPTAKGGDGQLPNRLKPKMRYGKIDHYVATIVDPNVARQLEEYSDRIGAMTIEGAIARLLENAIA